MNWTGSSFEGKIKYFYDFPPLLKKTFLDTLNIHSHFWHFDSQSQVQQITDENVCSEYWFMEVFAIDIQYYMWASLTNTRHVIFICKARGLIPLELVEGWMPPPHIPFPFTRPSPEKLFNVPMLQLHILVLRNIWY